MNQYPSKTTLLQQNLHYLSSQMGLTLPQIAACAGMTEEAITTLYNLQNVLRDIKPAEHALPICRYFDVYFDELLYTDLSQGNILSNEWFKTLIHELETGVTASRTRLKPPALNMHVSPGVMGTATIVQQGSQLVQEYIKARAKGEVGLIPELEELAV